MIKKKHPAKSGRGSIRFSNSFPLSAFFADVAAHRRQARQGEAYSAAGGSVMNISVGTIPGSEASPRKDRHPDQARRDDPHGVAEHLGSGQLWPPETMENLHKGGSTPCFQQAARTRNDRYSSLQPAKWVRQALSNSFRFSSTIDFNSFT